ncbi:CobW family GTP-binding protein [Marinicrinis lubricantis]|uniref:CobW family GTP-binding protein n=1 Tax=Marinicrinis lubricantis TaxID=2086470 RepID=A0ABW1IJH7_9BACL
MNQKIVPIIVLSGFLGSGKTTLLTKMIEYYKSAGRRPAVIMNELGDVNLDGAYVGAEIPMEEMLSGCICCTMRGDAALAVKQLVDEHDPDVILIEATGAANPTEIVDALTEASLYMPAELRQLMTVVDGPNLLEFAAKGKGRTYRLMKEQIRCASLLLLNKVDLLSSGDKDQVMQLIEETGTKAPVIETVACEIELSKWLEDKGQTWHNHRENADPLQLESGELSGIDQGHHTHAHSSHEHMMVVTHYLQQPLNSEKFDQFIRSLPENVYRGKGIVRFSDTTGGLYLFQYAYRETDYMAIEPQGELSEVVVLIGEGLHSKQLIAGIENCI